MAAKKYSLTEASRFLAIPLLDLVRDASQGKIKHTEEENQVSFKLDDLLEHDGYISVYSAKQYIADELSRKKEKPKYEVKVIYEIGLRERALETRIVQPKSDDPYLRKTYVHKKSLDKFLSGRTFDEYRTFEEAMDYLREKVIEKGFKESVLLRMSKFVQRTYWANKGLQFPEKEDRMKRIIDDYAAKIYNANTQVTLAEAAEHFYRRIRNSGTAAERKVKNLPQVKQLFQGWAHKKVISAQTYINPADNRETLCISKEKVESITEGYISHEEFREERDKRYWERSQDYREIMNTINLLRKGVARVAHTRLPTKTILSKPKGGYGSIRYNSRDDFSGEERCEEGKFNDEGSKGDKGYGEGFDEGDEIRYEEGNEGKFVTGG